MPTLSRSIAARSATAGREQTPDGRRSAPRSAHRSGAPWTPARTPQQGKRGTTPNSSSDPTNPGVGDHDSPDAPAANLSIRLFGPFSVQVNGAPLPRLRWRREEAILALLTLRHPPRRARLARRPPLAGRRSKVRGWRRCAAISPTCAGRWAPRRPGSALPRPPRWRWIWPGARSMCSPSMQASARGDRDVAGGGGGALPGAAAGGVGGGVGLPGAAASRAGLSAGAGDAGDRGAGAGGAGALRSGICAGRWRWIRCGRARSGP